MNRSRTNKLAVVIPLLLLPLFSLAQLPAYAPDRLVVKLADNVMQPEERLLILNNFSNGEVERLNNQFGFIRAERIYKGNVLDNSKMGMADISRLYLMHFSKELEMYEVIELYQATGYFEFVEPDYIGFAFGVTSDTFPNDPFFYRQWYLYNDSSFTLSTPAYDADIDMELGWLIETGKESVVLAIMDGGIRIDHPEFEGRLWVNKSEIPGNGKDDDYNGYSDDVNGYDFAYGDGDPSDDNGHGTAVAGLAAATGNNNSGYAGVDWNCKIMNCKVLEATGWGYYSVWIEGIYYAVNHGAHVINMSLGGESSSLGMAQAVEYAEANLVLVVAAMGNDGVGKSYYPAAIKNVIAVGSTDSDDKRSVDFLGKGTGGSNYGNHIDLVAPGNYIYILDHFNAFNYNYFGAGTSFSTPLVSGVASLLKAQDPARSPAEIRNILRMRSDDMIGLSGEDTPGWDRYYGYGRLNAFRALSKTTTHVQSFGEAVKVFPNPVQGKFNIVYRLFVDSDVHIRFYDRMGRLIRQPTLFQNQTIGTYSHTFSLSDMPGGVYYLKIEKEGQSSMHMIMIP